MKLIFILFCALTIKASAYDLFGPPVTVTVTSTSTQELAQDNLRAYLLIVNNGAVPVYVKFGSAQTGTEGVAIPAGGNYEPYHAPANSVWMDTASSTASCTIIQGH